MIGMDFLSFLVLAAIAIVVTAGKTVIGRGSGPADLVVAWLGSPVFGHWFEGIGYRQVFIVPALLGAAAALTLKETFRQSRSP